jgi:hypothetical protein
MRPQRAAGEKACKLASARVVVANAMNKLQHYSYLSFVESIAVISIVARKNILRLYF